MDDSFCIGAWRVEPGRCQISRDGRSVRLRAKVMDLLVFLARHPGEVLSKDVLLDGVWGLEALSESTLTRTVAELRQAFGDDAGEPTILETIPKRGYRLIAPVSSARADVPLPNTRRKPPVALAATVAIVIVSIMAAAAFFRRPPRPFEIHDWVLVTAFENATGDPLFDGTVERAYEHSLAASAFVNVVPPERVQDALALMRKPADTRVDAGVGREVCLRDGAIRAMVAGRIDKAQTGYVLTTRLVTPATGATIISFADQAQSRDDVLDVVARQVLAARKRLGEAGGSLEVPAALEKVTTASLRALQLYSRAVAPVPVGAPRDPGGEHLLKEALTADPDFASAHVMLAWLVAERKGPSEEYLAHARVAHRLSDDLTVVERHFIRGLAEELVARAGGDEIGPQAEHLERAAVEYEAVLRLQPDHYHATDSLVRVYDELQRPAGAVRRRLSDLRPNDFYLAADAAQWVLFDTGVEQARPYVARASQLLDRMPPFEVAPGFRRKNYVRMFRAHELWLAGKSREASAVLDAVGATVEMKAEGDMAFLRLGLFRLVLGQARRAEEACARINYDRDRVICQASVALARGDFPAVVAVLKDYGAGGQGNDVAPVSLLVRAGDLTAARRVLSRIRGVPPQHIAWSAAEIEQAAAAGSNVQMSLDASVPWTRAMHGVRAFMYTETLARTAMQAGDPTTAIRALEQTVLLREKTYNFAAQSGYFWMRTYLLLADIYRQTGRIGKAQAIEREILDALSEADEDYPLLVDVRSRVVRDGRTESSLDKH